MKALGEIGFKKSFKFFFTTIALIMLIMFKLMIFPQLRRWYLKLAGVKVGKNAVIHNVSFFNCYYGGELNLEGYFFVDDRCRCPG